MAQSTDKIYELMLQQKDEFFRYAQQDAHDKQKILQKMDNIENEVKDVHAQTRATNGRVTKLEDVVVVLKTDKDNRTRAYKLSWKGMTILGSLLIIIITPLLVTLGNFLKQQIENIFK
jgi:hypothetical protein